MSLFKNGVGRPSNETLKKRKIAYAAIAIGAVALLGTGGYLAYNFTRGDMSTSTKNITTKTLVYGDANGDEKVNINDATTIQAFLLGHGSLQETYPKAADVDGDGKISENDATTIQYYISKKVSSLPVKYGDINKDGTIDQKDISLVQDSLVQKTTLTAEQKVLADVDLDESVTALDASILKQYVEKQISSLPVLGSEMLSKDIPAATTSKGKLTVKVAAYKLDKNRKKTGSALKTVTDKDLKFDKWVNHEYMMVIDAKTTSGTIKSIKWQVNTGNKATTATASTDAAWKAGETKTYSYDKSSATKEIGMYADGVRLGKITVTDSNGNSKTINVKFYIDKTAPKLTFEITGTKSGSGYVPGAQVTATCTDNMEGLTYMYTYDTQDKSDSRTYNGTAVKTKSQKISLVSTGSARSITTVCKDRVGNSTGNKKSSSYAIGYYGNSNSATSNVVNATIKSMTCPSGYDKVNTGECRQVVSGVYKYTCPSGYSKIGDGPSAYCQYKTPAARPKSYVCSSPFKAVGTHCRYESAAVAKCTGGYKYDSNAKKCVSSYGARVNPTYSCGSTYYNGIRGSVSGSKCVYSYSATVKYGAYNCNNIGGKLEGSYCVTTKAVTKTRTYTYANPTEIKYSCPSGYKLDGTKCYKK